MRILAAILLAAATAAPTFAEDTPAEPNTAGINNVQVHNEQDEKLGEASEVIVNDSGQVAGVVLKVAADPQREVVVPIERVKRASESRKIVVAATPDEVKAMPELREMAPDTRADRP